MNTTKVYAMRDDGESVDVLLHDHRSTGSIYWSPRGENGRGGLNSYVIALMRSRPWRLDEPLTNHLVCVNGRGEVRWTVNLYERNSTRRQFNDGTIGGDNAEYYGALKHFDWIEMESEGE